MRILITSRFYLNGQTTHVLELCKGLVRQGHYVLLHMTNLHHPNYVQWLIKYRIHFVSGYRLENLLPRFREIGFDVIHNHSAHTIKQALDLGQILKVPVVTTCHYLDFAPLDLLYKSQHIVAISHEMATKLRGKRTPVTVIENGVAIPPAVRKKLNYNGVFIARITPQKIPGYEMVADWLLAHNWRVTILGDWHYPRTNYRGWKTDVYPELRKADLVIGTGRAIREGMAARCGALVLGDYLDGLVTPNNINSLAKTNFSGRTAKINPTPDIIARFLSKLDAETLINLQDFGRKYAIRNFSLDNMVKQVIDVYQRENNKRSKGN